MSAKRINITVDVDLLREIDAKAKRLGLKRSAFLAMAAKRAIADIVPGRA